MSKIYYYDIISAYPSNLMKHKKKIRGKRRRFYNRLSQRSKEGFVYFNFPEWYRRGMNQGANWRSKNLTQLQAEVELYGIGRNNG